LPRPLGARGHPRPWLQSGVTTLAFVKEVKPHRTATQPILNLQVDFCGGVGGVYLLQRAHVPYRPHIEHSACKRRFLPGEASLEDEKRVTQGLL
jgi:hypothetical protein